MEHIIKLYSYIDGINDIPFPSEAEQVTITSFKYEANRMAGAPTITATIKHRLCLDDLWTDNVYGTFNGEKYFIKNVPSSSKSNDDTRYEHSIELLSEREILNHVYFIDAVQGDSSTDVYKTNTTKFQFMGNIHEFANRLNASLQYSNLDYSVVVDSGISSEDKLVSFEDKYILEAMQEIFNTYEIPYYFVGKVIHIGYTDNAITHVFKYGHDEALLKISKDNANYQVVNRITAVGSSDNIPYYYPNESDDRAAIIASGKKWITPSQNLMPPVYRETNGAERFYNAKNNTYPDGEGGYYHFNNEYTPNNPLEGKQTFEEIKPTIKGMTNANGERIDMFMEFAYDRDDSDETDEEGNYLHPYFFAKLRKTDGANGFNLFEHAIESQAMQISMTSGDCGACTFEIGVGENTQQNIVQVDENGDLLRDDNGNVVRSGAPQPQQNDTENYEVWIALKKDDSTYSTLMPDASFNLRPSTNDTFVILGINLPQGYITRAEEELMKSMIKYMYMNNDEKFTFSISFSRIFFTEHPEILSQLNENSRLIIEYNGKQHTLYVNSFNYNMSDSQPLPEIQIDLVDTLTVGQNSLQTALDSVKQDILTSMGGGDFLQNGLRYFLRKDIQDTARGKITFKNGLDVGNFSSNVSGGTFREDENGNSYVETDTLFVRKKAIFQEYQIKKVSYIGGEYICSAASMDRIFRVEEHETFYRCYANDGSSSYENEFVAGDQAICRMSDLTQEHAVNRYYWRYVIAVGSNYIDLSKTDADAGSDIPVEGDILVQLGNRNDKTRQNAIIISSVSVDAPSIKLLRGINNFSTADKDDIAQGFDTTTGRGFLKIIGDFFAGAADDSTYVKYDAGRKVLEIKGKFLTGTGDNIEDIMNNIQNQIDGAIETWFYEPVPTLDNEPAVNWTTENDKNNHLGDLYYSGEGKAYRFQKDGDDYIWKLIQDTDITKALEAANQARQEAENARQEAEDATDRLNEWASDGVISPTEKQGIKDEITRIDADYTHINSEYTKYALGTPSAFNSAYTDYKAILVTLSADTPETIDIPNDFAAKQNKYYTERTNALDSISSKSMQLIEDAKAAADAAIDAAENAQDTADRLKNFTDQAFTDGIVDRAEASAIEKYINAVRETQQSVNGTYSALYGNAYLVNDEGNDTEEKKALKDAYDKLSSSINSLISIINSAIQDGIATPDEKATVDSAYSTFNTNLNSYNVAVENANKAIQDRLKGYSDEYAYLKKAFENDTSIEGGVVATSLVQLGFKDSTGKYNIKSGINGIYDDEALGNGISYWAGGLPIDREMYEEDSIPENAATALIRMDGTGYLADGNISWDANGKITTNKGAFYFGDELIDRYLDLFTLHVVNGNIDYITPNHPFSSIEVNTRIRIGDAYLEWDSENNGVKVYGIYGEEVGLYALGYISSMGVSDSGSGGGGGSVDLLQDWNKYDSTSSKSTALSAYLGKDLLDRIVVLETGKRGHTIVINGSGNVVTNVVESGNTLTFTKGNIDANVTIDKITDLHADWDALLKASPSDYVTRWPSISEVSSKQNLVIKLNGGASEGTNQFTYNVTAAKTVNITTSNIGADAKFVTALGVDRNYLTWTKNGITDNIIIPFAEKANQLNTAYTINGTSFDGTTNIITSQWGAPRNISISDSSSNYTGVSTSVNGASDITLKLPSTITATIHGNADSSTKLQTGRNIWGQNFDGSSDIIGVLFNVTGATLLLKNEEDNSWNDGENSHYWYGLDMRHNNTGVYSLSLSNYYGMTLKTDAGNLSIDRNGNIGIGTYTPNYKLEVNGTGYFGGQLTSQSLKIGNGTITWDGTNNCFHFSHGLYSDEFVSAFGLKSSTGEGGGGVSYSRLDSWSDYSSEKSGWVLSAALGYELHEDMQNLNSNAILNVSPTGTGNVVTEVSKSGTTLSVTKGLTALTTNDTANMPQFIGTVDIDDLDDFASADFSEMAPLATGEKPLRYIVTYTLGKNTRIVGILDMFLDDMNHVLTQVLMTHYIIDADGTREGHRDDQWFTYTRSFNINAPNLSDVEKGTWGKWSEAYRYTGQFTCMGMATPTTVPQKPITDREIYYIATEAGTYTNFLDSNESPLSLADGEVALFISDSRYNSIPGRKVYKKQTLAHVGYVPMYISGRAIMDTSTMAEGLRLLVPSGLVDDSTKDNYRMILYRRQRRSRIKIYTEGTGDEKIFHRAYAFGHWAKANKYKSQIFNISTVHSSRDIRHNGRKQDALILNITALKGLFYANDIVADGTSGFKIRCGSRPVKCKYKANRYAFVTFGVALGKYTGSGDMDDANNYVNVTNIVPFRVGVNAVNVTSIMNLYNYIDIKPSGGIL